MSKNVLIRLGLLVRPQFFEPRQCAELRKEIAGASREVVPVYSDEADAEEVDSRARVGWRVRVSPATAAGVAARLDAAREIAASHFDVPLIGVEPPQFIVYGRGGFYRPHRDSAADDEPAPEMYKARKVSGIVFLTGEADGAGPATHAGGSLAFYDLVPGAEWRGIGLPLRGEEGMLVAFPSGLLHEVTPVTAGERVTIVTCFS